MAHFIHRYPPAPGGAEHYCHRLTAYLQQHGHLVDIYTSTAHDLSGMWSTGFREAPASDGVQRFRPLRFPGRRYLAKALSLVPWPPWQAYWLPCNPICPGMLHAVNRTTVRYDAVHAFAFPYAFLGLCAWKLANRLGIPFLLTPFLHLGDLDNPANRLRRQYTSRPLRWLLRQADRVFVQTLAELEAVASLEVPRERIVLQGLGVEPTECTGGDRQQARKNWQIPEHEFVIGHLANASPEKGTIDLLKAVAGRFWVVLAGPEMPKFQHFWKTFPGPDRVRRLGELTDDQKRDFYAGLDLFVLPSVSDSFGLVLLEAWANGLPNVVYRAGGPGSLVRDGVDGRVVRSGDVRQLGEVLAELADDAAGRQRLGQAGLARVQDFSWSRQLQIVLDQLELATTSKTNLM